MKGSALKWTVLGGVLVFIVLYGMEMSSAGIEKIYGPIEGSEAASVQTEAAAEKDTLPAAVEASDETAGLSSSAEKKIEELQKELAEVRKIAERSSHYERLLGIPKESTEPSVNKLADGASGFLQSFSSGGIRFVVSLFDSVTN